jgi:hypothetical protein
LISKRNADDNDPARRSFRDAAVGPDAQKGGLEALMRKGPRLIVVDDSTYRWVVRRRPTYCQAMGWTPLTFAVELMDAHGAVMVAALPVAHPSNWLGLPTTAVRPGLVASVIRDALAAGWMADRPGSPFTVTVTDLATEMRAADGVPLMSAAVDTSG